MYIIIDNHITIGLRHSLHEGNELPCISHVITAI